MKSSGALPRKPLTSSWTGESSCLLGLNCFSFFFSLSSSLFLFFLMIQGDREYIFQSFTARYEYYQCEMVKIVIFEIELLQIFFNPNV